MQFNLALLTSTAIRTIREIQIEIRKDIASDPEAAFEPASVGRQRKALLTVDLVAERNTARKLRDKLPYSIQCYGEESLRKTDLDLSSEKSLVVLMDMVDGTDLLERGFSNWCSAMVFFYPPDARILAAFVGIPEEGVYFATEEGLGAQKYRFHMDQEAESTTDRYVPVRGLSKVDSVQNSSLCFYGQQISHLKAVIDTPLFRTLHRLNTTRHKKGQANLKTRVYNFAGNPMMMRMIDGPTRVDAVFETMGQAPHDVVPGGYILQKAGATIQDLSGNPLDLGKRLLRPADPASKIRYVMASTVALAAELRSVIKRPVQQSRARSGVANAKK